MSERPPAETTVSAPSPSPPEGPTNVALARSLRDIKWWLVGLTVVVAILAAFVVGAAVFDDDRQEYAGEVWAPSDEQVAGARAEIEDAFGDRLESLEVRLVEPDGDLGECGPPPSLYVEYRLRGAGTIVAALVVDPFMPISSSGLLPTRGSLVSRMSDEQFEGILAAYAAVTPAPLGGVRRYTDSLMMMPQQAPAIEIESGGRTYATDELWAVMEGTLVEGARIGADEMASAYGGGTVHVFHEDPKTGEFTYLGTEPAGGWW